MKPPSVVLRPDRIRTIERPFAWIPCRLLTDGYLSTLSAEGKQLYLFLALVSNREGLSFYSDHRIHQRMGLEPSALNKARTELINTSLLAFDGRTYQLLSLPPSRKAVVQQSESNPPKASTNNHSVNTSQPDEMPEDVQRILCKLLGQDHPLTKSNR